MSRMIREVLHDYAAARQSAEVERKRIADFQEEINAYLRGMTELGELPMEKPGVVGCHAVAITMSPNLVAIVEFVPSSGKPIMTSVKCAPLVGVV